MGKVNLIITNESDYRKPEEGIFRFSNKQWMADPHKLEGYDFHYVIVRCKLDDSLRNWLHTHLGIRIHCIVYENPLTGEQNNG